MLFSIELSNLLAEAANGNLGIQLRMHTRHSVINDTNIEFIPDWREQMKKLHEEIINLNAANKRDAFNYLKNYSNGVYECYVNWIENSGIFEIVC